ncbi:urotensin-2B [Camelus dromedarius]|uniref:Urotensin-2B n=1 Tax=Camelus ferus TaxID=419612 RepID=A0A8B6YJD8_CAMFR|nr:urotensin-2B [Camelus ferus]XP_010957561.1 urotensin-2B [Camelus bactrianus]XP_010992671.1 urotensin-2B [Camelus dromedarius]
MNKILSTIICFGLLTLLSVTIFLESVHGLPYFIQGNKLFPDKEDTNHEDLLLALLTNNFDFQRASNIDAELANKLEELNQLEKLKQQLMEVKDNELSYAIDDLSSSHPNKRACFWKYCV